MLWVITHIYDNVNWLIRLRIDVNEPPALCMMKYRRGNSSGHKSHNGNKGSGSHNNNDGYYHNSNRTPSHSMEDTTSSTDSESDANSSIATTCSNSSPSRAKAMKQSQCQDEQDQNRSGLWIPNFPSVDFYFLVASVALYCYVNALSGEMVHDDIYAIQNNNDVLPCSPVTRLFVDDFWGRPLSDPKSHKSYRPLTVLTFR